MSLAQATMIFVVLMVVVEILRTIIVNRELDDVERRLTLLEYDFKTDKNSQMSINDKLLSFQDRIIGKYADLNTRIIELEARIPEPEYDSTDEDQVELGIDEYYSEKVEAED